MTLRQALEPPDPGGADSDPLLGSLFCWLQLPFFRCLLQKNKPGGLSGLPPKSGSCRGSLPTSGTKTSALLGLGDGLCLAGQQKAHENRYSHLLGACCMPRHYAKYFTHLIFLTQQSGEIGSNYLHFADDETKAQRG